MFTYYIARASLSFGLPATRPIYERAIEALPDTQTAEMCMRFAQLERKLGEIDRARAVYSHASQFCDPRVRSRFIHPFPSAFCFFLEDDTDEGLVSWAWTRRRTRNSGRNGTRSRLKPVRRIRSGRYVGFSFFPFPFSSPSSFSLRSTTQRIHSCFFRRRQYLRIKRAVQAAFNTEASYLSAKLQQMQSSAAAAAAEAAASGAGEAADPMAALESGAGGAMRGFVAASSAVKIGGGLGEQEKEAAPANADEIAIDDDDEDDE